MSNLVTEARLLGVAAAPGLAVAPCLIVRPFQGLDDIRLSISVDQVDGEIKRFDQAVDRGVTQIEAIRSKAEAAGELTGAAVIEAQAFMLMDPVLLDGVKEKIQGLLPAERAVQETIEEHANILAGLDDPYLRERAQDIRDLGGRLLGILTGQESMDLSNLESDVILVGYDITPSQMASLDTKRVKGIVAEIGGKTSHTAILANNMEIPAVLGCVGVLSHVEEGQTIFVDGSAGAVEVGISEKRAEELQTVALRRKQLQETLKELVNLPTQTKDGFRIELAANIMNPQGAERAISVGADGVGLYRTEFLYMDRPNLPSEEEQYQVYSQAVKAFAGKPVIIRTMDIGGDKEVASLKLPKEDNPFLGYRALRICLDNPELFKAQLRAILRAGAHGKALIMYPMVASLQEIRAANAILEEAKESLRKEGLPFDESLEVGIMIEIPSAAITADLLVDDVAFFSIGSNDLTQYTLAVDRMNQRISHLYNHFEPGVLRLIRNVIQVANQAESPKFAGMCGEMAADPLATLLLLGFGMTEFSVNPANLLRIKKIITSVEMSYAKKVAEEAMQLSTAEEIVAYLKESIPEELREYL